MGLGRAFKLHFCTALWAVSAVAISAQTSRGPTAVPDETPRPDHVVVVANSREPESEKIARYYMQQRKIPDKNLLLIDAPVTYDITWAEFVDKIFNPLRARLTKDGWFNAYVSEQKDRDGRLRYIFFGNKVDFLVVCYGVPVRIQNDPARLVETPLTLEHKELNSNQAAVDSELSLLAALDTPTAGFVANPLYQKTTPNPFERASVVKVARLDGPSPAAVRGMIDSAIEGEITGLQGRAYVDMGGPHQEGEDWLKSAAATIRKLGFDLSEDHNKDLFSWRTRFDAPAIYLGWYSAQPSGPIADPAFHFPPGAIAVHIHSFSASVLRTANQQWAGALITHGAAATLGNVYEPYLSFTHHLDLFMEALAAGKSAGEAAYYAMPVLSWQGIFLGDPLYHPFAIGLPLQLDLATHVSTNMPLSVYVIIRQMNLLQEQGRQTDAYDYGLAQFKRTPDVALAVSLVQLGHRLGKDEEAFKLLSQATAGKPVPHNRLGLYAEAANLADSAFNRPLALSLYTQALEAAGPDAEFTKVVLPDAIAAANDAGETALRDRWQKQLDALTPKK